MFSSIGQVISWKQSHHSGNITFKDGYIIVGVTGYRENKYIAIGYRMYIDDRNVLKAQYIGDVSNLRKNKYYHTQYIGALFKVNKGQKISIRTPFEGVFYFSETSSYFGAFMIHR